MNALELKNVTYVYSKNTPFEKKALSDVSVYFKSNMVNGLIGHTGSGKSTLVQMMNGLLKPDGGEILLFGKNIWDEPKKIRDIRFKVGLVFQYPEHQLFEQTCRDDIAYGPRNMKLDEDEVARRVSYCAEFVGISEDILGKSPFELSGGQKRRVALAGVMAMEPEVLVLDEPAAGLDPIGREEILAGIRSYQKKRKNTVIMVSHSMEDMASYCDRIAVMRYGTVFMEGNRSEIFARGDELTEVGLGVPQITRLMNILSDRGLDVRRDIFTVTDACFELKKLFGGVL